jgi:thiamine pyrophosphokinase
MSSHHIVRDEQEPAMLLAGKDEALLSIAKQLLEWSPTVLVAEQAMEEALMLGIKIDGVFCAPARVDLWREKLLEQAPIHLLSYAEGESVEIAALTWIAASQHRAVNILLDHMPATPMWEPFLPMIDVVVYTPRVRWTWLRTGHLEKWVPAGTAFEWGPQALEISGLTPQGLAVEEGLVCFKAEEAFWLGEKIPHLNVGNL